MPTLNWLGRNKVENLKVPFHFLQQKYSVGNSQNKIIHADNLLALKSLLPRYENKIKCIYIDPPYNTGNEGWIYNDNVNDPQLKKWLGQVVGKEGEDLTRHDKWLCMMYPRLKLLQRLLRDDGAIFISIDDNEQANLKLICDDIFGASNFVTVLTVVVKTEGRQYGSFAKTHEYTLVYAKNIDSLQLNKIEVKDAKFKYADEKGGFNTIGLRNRAVRIFNSTNRPNLRYPFYVDENNKDEYGFSKVTTIPTENFTEVLPSVVDGLESVWRWGKDTAEKNKDELVAMRGKDKEIRIFKKDRTLTTLPKTVWFEKEFNSIVGTREIKEIFGNAAFDFPKPLNFVQQILQIGTDKNSIVLDSFAGSGTTAHAVLNLNQQDGGSRRFILIELNDYAENITAERVRRIGGEFSFYEMGEKLFDDDGFLNENAPLEKIFDYVYFSETGKDYVPCAEKNLLGVNDDTVYYFFNGESLNWSTLAQIKTRAKNYVIYAEACNLSDDELDAEKITFKQIPFDIYKY